MANGVVQLMKDFYDWLWGPVAPPPRKTWCAAFYFVADIQTINLPDPALDKKLDEIIAYLKNAKFDEKNSYVAYRAIWADATVHPPAAAIVTPPTSGSVPPPACLSNFSHAGTDLPCFLEWLYTACPADHYALFFWGHSFGPAGLFEPGGQINIKTPIAVLRNAFERFMLLRQIPPGSPPEELKDGVPPKIEIVFFQDCWMSSLETAYELRNSVAHIVASQSLVPSFTWPYQELVADLAGAGYQQRTADRVAKYHQDHFAQIINLVSVPIALLNLDNASKIAGSVKALIASIDALALDCDQRWQLFQAGQIVRMYQGTLTAGDAALIDIPKLCADLANHTDLNVKADAAALLKVVASVIASNQEVVRPGNKPLGFAGISALYVPPKGKEVDDYITQAVYPDVYNNSQFVTDTEWPGAEQVPNPKPKCA